MVDYLLEGQLIDIDCDLFFLLLNFLHTTIQLIISRVKWLHSTCCWWAFFAAVTLLRWRSGWWLVSACEGWPTCLITASNDWWSILTIDTYTRPAKCLNTTLTSCTLCLNCSPNLVYSRNFIEIVSNNYVYPILLLDQRPNSPPTYQLVHPFTRQIL